MTTLGFQTFFPNRAMALTSGPTQPEVAGFEPVGTTDMVDPFTGDFIYNIPLLDVEGYPINISYHGGVGMEQEASWVGLGWSLTPGVINKSIRGIPDDFAGDSIEKEIYVKPEKNLRFGVNGGFELGGISDPFPIKLSASLGSQINFSNYRGVSLDFSAGLQARLNIVRGMVSPGLNIGASVGSQSGGSFNYDANLSLGATKSFNGGSLGLDFNLNAGGVYSQRRGLQQSWGMGVTTKSKSDGAYTTSSQGARRMNPGLSNYTGISVPIGLQNFSAAVSNAAYSSTVFGRFKPGGEFFGVFGNMSFFGSFTKTGYETNGSRPSFGYLNLEDAGSDALLDFSREKDGYYNNTMQLLPQAATTYDVYSVAGQGTGGSFRPFRNDLPGVFDPTTASSGVEYSAELEVGIGNLVEGGLDLSKTTTDIQSGPWQDYQRPNGGDDAGLYEKVFFKEAGELTGINEAAYAQQNQTAALTPDQANALPVTKPNTGSQRAIRTNYIYTLTGRSADQQAYLDGAHLQSYDSSGFKTFPTVAKTTIPRKTDVGKLRRKEHHVTEIVQVQKDGRRYVYGLPVVNNIQREVVFAINANQVPNAKTGQIRYTSGLDDIANNGNGLDHFYSSTTTPTYTTSHLLTGVLSADYSDVTGDGMTDDDAGSFTKFNYTRKSRDYRWRAPIHPDSALWMPGYRSDKQDDKAAYTIGSREQWYLHSVETKNFVAEFYISPRKDARGVTAAIATGGMYSEAPYNTTADVLQSYSYKLDSIVVYNKHDRFRYGAAATPVKSVHFTYDYSLCRGVPNSADYGVTSDIIKGGKLTLKQIQVRFGTSNFTMTAPYRFTYGGINPNYFAADKDRWGSYKPSDPDFSNFDFPFVKQGDASADTYAAAWSLTDIQLPTGGKIKVNYEADDYAYVQDREAMEMFLVRGLGFSPQFSPGNTLYQSQTQPRPALYVYFDRRPSAEIAGLSPKDNYLKGTNLLYFNIPVQLRGTAYEWVKGYGEVKAVGYCSDNIHGWIELKGKDLIGTGNTANPILMTALNLGRYSLPHILYPGADMESSTLKNIMKGLAAGAFELATSMRNPMENMMLQGYGRQVQNGKGFVRLTSPGLRKKGGGQRVRRIEFHDGWASMTGGADSSAVYGREYDYTTTHSSGKYTISSGVASYEPLQGGDEIPQREPFSTHIVQNSNDIPPNDPVELYSESPIGESFFPSPVVGYSRVTVRSIHRANARSAQFEDVHVFATAKDYPVRIEHTAIQRPTDTREVTMFKINVEQEVTQGFSITLNDMHGKPVSQEHWLLLPTGGKRELVSYTNYKYKTAAGRLNNQVLAYQHNPTQGTLSAVTRTLGIETEVTLDARERVEKTNTDQIVASVNTFGIPFPPFIVIVPYGYPWDRKTSTRFAMATATKITQQYGIPERVIRFQEGAITEQVNEVWDPQTGAPAVTSINNEFGDREYSVTHPAYWAYKEMAPTYRTQNMTGVWPQMVIDSLAEYAPRLVNWPGVQAYPLASNMPVGLVMIDEKMPLYNLGDEILVHTLGAGANPVRMWMLGYTSDEDHCYLVVAPREPYKHDAYWPATAILSDVHFRVVRSGERNRVSETVQSMVTTAASDVLPTLKNTQSGLITLQAQTMHHRLTRVAARHESNDSLNPFVTSKVGMLRPERTVVNIKDRQYLAGAARQSGLFPSLTYWTTVHDTYPAYCPDSSLTNCSQPLIKKLNITKISGRDSLLVVYELFNTGLTQKRFGWGQGPTAISDTLSVNSNNGFFIIPDLPMAFFTQGSNPNNAIALHYYTYSANYNSGCRAVMRLSYINGNVKIELLQNGPNYAFNPPQLHITNYQFAGSFPGSPFRVRKKIQLATVEHNPVTNTENWVSLQRAALYDVAGNELENEEPGIGSNAAVYGYHHSLPATVAKNATYGSILFEGFEDYALLNPVPSLNADYLKLAYSPFSAVWTGITGLSAAYNVTNPIGGNCQLVGTSHTGTYGLQVNATLDVPIPKKDSVNLAQGFGKRAFNVEGGKDYLLRFWIKPTTAPAAVAIASYTFNGGIKCYDPQTPQVTAAFFPAQQTTTPIEGWQQMEVLFTPPANDSVMAFNLPAGFVYDDFKLIPASANSKGFVYHPVTRKLMATLDENNFATFYEYDLSGNLIRTKKETERGILTLSESRSGHPRN